MVGGSFPPSDLDAQVLMKNPFDNSKLRPEGKELGLLRLRNELRRISTSAGCIRSVNRARPHFLYSIDVIFHLSQGAATRQITREMYAPVHLRGRICDLLLVSIGYVCFSWRWVKTDPALRLGRIIVAIYITRFGCFPTQLFPVYVPVYTFWLSLDAFQIMVPAMLVLQQRE